MAFPPYVQADIGAGLDRLAETLRANGDAYDKRLNAETQRKFAENEQRRMSSRDAMELDKEARAKAKEIHDAKAAQFHFLTLPAVRALAEKNPALASQNAEGVRFEQTNEPAPIPAFPEQQGAPEAQAALAPRIAPPEANSALLGYTPPAPLQGPTPSGAPLSDTENVAPVEEAPPLNVEAATAERTPPTMRHTHAVIDGQRIEMPSQEHAAPGSDAKFGDVYDFFLEQTNDPTKALALAERHDQATRAVAAKVAGQEDAQAEAAKFHLTTAQQEEEKRLAREQSETNAKINAAGRVGAAGPGFKQESANDRAMTLIERRAKAVRDTSQFAKLVAADKNLRGVMTNIADGTVPLQHKDAQISLARIFRQAQPTEGEMRLLYDGLGGTSDKWNQFVAHMTNGDLSTEQLRQVKLAAKAVAKEHATDVQRFQGVAKSFLGPGSGMEQFPDQAQGMYNGMAAELGLENLPPLYSTEGGVSLGTKKAPKTKPRAAAPSGDAGGDLLTKYGYK
jgi:hypothetical protein